jgi:outer membrane protein assembly factor BamB
MRNLYAVGVVTGLGILGVAASRAFLPVAAIAPLSSSVPETIAADVTQHHNHASRDGLYLDPLFTPTAAANLARDLNFNGTISGNVYAQPLYIENGPGGAAMVIAVTQSNNVYALDAATGTVIWQRNVGAPVTSGLPCGNINPVGITNTPIVDLASRSLFFDAEVSPGSGSRHMIFSLNVDTGDTNPGWPVDVNAAVAGFDSNVQSSRAAAGIVGNILYVPYGGRFGDCGAYRGRLVGVQMNNPAVVMNWATQITRAGVWGPGGVASDGNNPFVVTGNGSSTGTWSGSEAVIRLQPGPVFTGNPADYWAPTNWQSLDSADADLGGCGAIIVDVPGATPSALVVALGKDGNAYILNRNNLGGVSAPLAQASVGGTIIQAAATYKTSLGTFVVLRPSTGTLTAFRITATNPPTIATGWSVSSSGRTSPFVTTTDGTSNAIVWAAGSDGRLRGYNGDTGAIIFSGGGANELMTGVRSFNTGIAARGRIYYATDNKVWAFTVPTTPPTPTATATSTASATATATATATIPPTPTATATASATVTATATVPPTATPSPSSPGSPSPTATATVPPTASPTPSSPGSPTPAAQALNLSTRMLVLTEDQVGIGGFIITGNEPKTVLVRGIGPSLGKFGVPNPLADPTMELHGPSGFVTLNNNNWRDTQEAEIQATGLAPTNDLESAILATLPPGNYTAIVKGVNNGTGVGLVEAFDLGQAADSKLGNISTRAFVSTGTDIMIAGFILGNGGSTNIILRGIGPSLSNFGVPNALEDPTLELRDDNGALLRANDNWMDDPKQAAILTAAGLALSNNLESGIAATLPPGLYTALLAGQNGVTGVGLVEVYDRGGGP